MLPQPNSVRVSLPRLGISSGLTELRLDGPGVMEVPPDPAVPGCYALGPTPGALGPAVIAGHVTWNRAPAVFFRLGEARQGDRGDRNGREVRQGSVPHFHGVGNIDHAGLRLVTCGGEYDDLGHRYLDNSVVFASLVAIRSAKG